MRKLVVLAYIVLFAAAVFVYVHYPTLRDEVKFWLPQGLLALTLVMTSLYVLLTAELVSETRRLQQRPLVEIAFREVDSSKCKGPKLAKLYEHGLGIYQGLAKKMVEGEKVTTPSRSLVLELKNIGQASARAITVGVKITDPTGNHSDELTITETMEKDAVVEVQIAPSPIPFGIIEVTNLSYGDGLRTYTENAGSRTFNSGLE